MPTPNGMFGGPWLVLWWSGVIVSFGAGCSGILIVQLCAAMVFGLPLFGNSPTVCFGMSLDKDYRGLIHNFRRKFEELQAYAHDTLEDGVELRTSWKVHILICHLDQWLNIQPFVLTE